MAKADLSDIPSIEAFAETIGWIWEPPPTEWVVLRLRINNADGTISYAHFYRNKRNQLSIEGDALELTEAWHRQKEHK